jgi:transcription antitermination factor NusG
MTAAIAERPCSLPERAQWYAVVTRYRCERKVCTSLQQVGVTVFLPLVEQIHRWSDRNKRIFVPLFAGYLFICLQWTPSARLMVLRTPGVMRFVEFGQETAAIPTQQIEHLKLLLSQGIHFSLHAFLNVGQRVRIRGGCLDGLEGILEHNGEKSLVISIESIQRSVAIRIENYDLELI